MSDVGGKHRVFAREHGIGGIGKDQVAAIPRPVHDRLDVLAAQLRRRIDVGDEPDCWDTEYGGTGRNRRRHLAEIVEEDRVRTDRAQLRGELLQQQELARRARRAPGALVGAGIHLNVAEKPSEDAGRSHVSYP